MDPIVLSTVFLMFFAQLSNGVQLVSTPNTFRTFNIAVVLSEGNSHHDEAVTEARKKFADANQMYIENWKVNFESFSVNNCTSCGVLQSLEAIHEFVSNNSHNIDGAIFLKITTSTAMLSSILNNMDIPTIGLFDKTKQDSSMHSSPYFTRMRTSPIHSYAYVMKEIIQKMGWRTLFVVTTADQEGLKFADEVKYFALRRKWRLYRTVWIDSSFNYEQAISTLRNINETRPKAVLMFGHNDNARKFLKIAAKFPFRNASFTWLITERSCTGIPVDSMPVGVLTVKHRVPAPKFSHGRREAEVICDAMGVFYKGFKATVGELCGDGRTNGCTGKLGKAEVGQRVSRYIGKISYKGLSDEFHLTAHKDVPTKPCEIWNIQQDYGGHNYWTNIGLWTPSGLALDRFCISSGAFIQPLLSAPRPTLRVPVIATPAWLTVGRIHANTQDTHNIHDPAELCTNGEPCYAYNETKNSTVALSKTVYCCAGTQIDLLQLLQRDLNFKADIYFVPDGIWGSQDENTSEWNGLMQELMSGRGDVTAFLGISSERSKYVEFTQPYFTVGLNILVKTIKVEQIKKPAINWNFLTPFNWDLWLMVVASCNVVLVVIWGLDRMSPRGHRRRLQILEQDAIPVDDGFTLLDSMSYVWGVAFSKDIGAENTPRSPSARFVSIFFAFMALILVNTYCANLTAFLLKDNVVLPINGIQDEKLINPTLYPPDGFQLGVVRGSFEESYFKNHKKKYLQQLYDVNIKINLVSNYSEGFDFLKKGKLDGLVGDDVSLQSQAILDDCGYRLTKKSFYELAVAFAFPKGSPLLDEANLSVLKNQENGTIDQIKKLRFPVSTCKQQSVREFVIADFSGLFLTVAAVIGFGLVAVIAEVILLIILIEGQRCLGRFGTILREFILEVRDGEERYLSFRTIYNFGITEKSWNVNQETSSSQQQNTDPHVGRQNNGFVINDDFDNGFTRTLQRQRLHRDAMNNAVGETYIDLLECDPKSNGSLQSNGRVNGLSRSSSKINKRHKVHLETSGTTATESSRL